MKEKEFFKDQYHKIMAEMVKMGDELSKKGTEVDKETDKIKQQLIMLEAKNQDIHE